MLWLDSDRNRIPIGLKSEWREPHGRRHSWPDDWIDWPLHDPAKGLIKRARHFKSSLTLFYLKMDVTAVSVRLLLGVRAEYVLRYAGIQSNSVQSLSKFRPELRSIALIRR